MVVVVMIMMIFGHPQLVCKDQLTVQEDGTDQTWLPPSMKAMNDVDDTKQQSSQIVFAIGSYEDLS
jgi:hypothetical protein